MSKERKPIYEATDSIVTDNKGPILSFAVFVKTLDHEYLLSSKKKAGIQEEIWSLPGGNVKFGESLNEAAQRCVMEETGCRIHQTAPLTDSAFFSHIYPNGNHHILVILKATIFLADVFQGTKEVFKDGQNYVVKWCAKRDFPDNLMEPLSDVMRRVRANQEIM